MELFPDDPALRAPAEAPAPAAGVPLAERMRPRTLEEFAGQTHLLGPGRPLHPVVEGHPLTSTLFWGPPGSGKTTLARLLAERAGLRFAPLSAVHAGLKELRELLEEATRLRRTGRGTALFVDEIHRWSKAQQDALLPHVERGAVVLLGATTENPSFEVISALRSRCRILTLHPLELEELEGILRRALGDAERGLGKRRLAIDPDTLALLCRLAVGDARRALSLLESASWSVQAGGRLDRSAVEAALEARPPDYDKGGEAHYDVISAFIKSLRGSDPDAATYWLVRMLEGGEDPRFIARRMMIFAAEDIGNADPRALSVAVAAAEGFERVGLPEGGLVLTQAATYLATAPKSNAALRALGAAREAVREHGALPVPLHLRNAPTELMRREGYGKGYDYPHDHPDHFVRADYLPDALRGARFYEPSDQGEEAEIARRQRERWSPDGKPKR